MIQYQKKKNFYNVRVLFKFCITFYNKVTKLCINHTILYLL